VNNTTMILDVLQRFVKANIYLASASPRRIELLQNLGFSLGKNEGSNLPFFTVKPSKFSETLEKSKFSTPGEYAIATAFGKAEDVLNNELSDKEKSGLFVLIGCDTVVESPSGEVFEKPQSVDDAQRMLRQLSNKTHYVHSGVVILVKKSPLHKYTSYTFSDTTEVSFADLPESLILSHSQSVIDHDKAGGYAIQGRASAFCVQIKGSYPNVVGLPINKLGEVLREILTSDDFNDSQ